jgi:2',3'-cyclic-nucleotide 2'-phosphodiesterase (5'-nucleotidase family)
MATRTLTILQLNDTHAYLEPHPEVFWGRRLSTRTAGGFARIATLLRQIRNERPGAVLALDNGDTFHGTYVAVQSRGEALVPLLNALELDGMTGHWDFAYGPAQLQSLTDRLSYPMLAANCFRADSDELVFPASRMLERGGVRVGVIGLAATIVDKTMPAHFSEGIRLTLGNVELPAEIGRLRTAGAELIVLLSHLGFPQDVKLAGEVAGIDILLSGHTHNRLSRPAVVGTTHIIQSGCHGSFVGRLDITLDGGQIRDVAHRLILVDESIVPDPAIAALVEEAVTPHRALLREPVGATSSLLHRATTLEAPMDTLLLRAIAAAAEAPIALSNGWRYGAPIPPGVITLGDLWNIMPPNPPVSLVELSGTELWDLLEENLEHTLAADPYRQMGGYLKRLHGLTLYAKLENSTGQRVQELVVGEQPVKRAERYAVAFVTTQGVPAKYGTGRHDLPLRAIDALRTYLAGQSPVTVPAEGTVVPV